MPDSSANDRRTSCRHICIDCGVDTREIGEEYVLQQPVWLRATRRGGMYGMLCIACCERRLKRPLERSDFRLDVPLNDPRQHWKSPLLRDRMGFLDLFDQTDMTVTGL